MTIYKAASFFSGIGGLDLAFAWSGFDIRLHVEIDDYCRKILHKNRVYWKNSKQLKDIKNVTKSQVGNVDVMFGGFPCQDISIAGKRAGITTDTRSGLWFEFLRLIRQVRPKVVVLENVSAIHVPTIDEHGNKQPAPGLIVSASLSEVGYDCIWLPIRASDIGAPHQRERWFCIAYDMGSSKSKSSHASKYHARKRMVRKSLPKLRNASRTRNVVNATRQHEKRNKQKGNNFRESAKQIRNRRSNCGGRKRIAKSQLGGVNHGFAHRLDRHRGQFPNYRNLPQYDYEPSRITDRTEHRRSRLKSLGNAVVPQQAYPIAQAVKMFLDRTYA